MSIWQIKTIAGPSKQDQKTFSFDLKETKEGQPYLTITESRFMGEGQDQPQFSAIIH